MKKLNSFVVVAKAGSRRRGPRTKIARQLVLVVAVMALLLSAVGSGPATAGPEFCDPPESGSPPNGCLPSPAQCATGRYEGRTESGIPGRAVECRSYFDPVTGLRRIAHYMGGQPNRVCGAIISENKVVAGQWTDPDGCPGVPVERGHAATGNRYHPTQSGESGAIASISPLATSIGMDVLEAGGNAIDAAVATVFGVGVTNQEGCGIGGGGFLVYRSSNGELAALDFRETAPAAMKPDTLWEQNPVNGNWQLKTGSIAEGTGHLVVGVPGTVAGMAAALDRFGSRTLAEVIQPAAELARQGFPLTADIADVIGWQRVRFMRYPETAKTYLDATGQPLPPAPLSPPIAIPDLAATLETIASEGPDAFYTGSIAKAIVADMEASALAADPGTRGIMTAEDLASYAPVWRDALVGHYRDAQIIAMPPPTSGGVFTIEMLNILERVLRRDALHSSADHIHALVEAEKIAWADRNKYLADSDFEDVPTDELISKRYAQERATEIGYTAGSYSHGDLENGRRASASGHEGRNTSHISVIDAAGNAVAITCTIEQAFGSAVTVPGTGMLLNNELTDFNAPGTANEAEGGKRPRSSMSPTIVVRHGQPVLVLGGVGGPMIPMTVASAVSNVVDFDLDVTTALDLARFSEPTCCRLTIEDARIPEEALSDLAARGHVLARAREYGFFPFALNTAWLQAVGYDHDLRGYVAASDPRVECGAAILTLAGELPQCPN